MQVIKGYIHRTIEYASNLFSLFADGTEPAIVPLIKPVLSPRDSSNVTAQEQTMHKTELAI